MDIAKARTLTKPLICSKKCLAKGLQPMLWPKGLQKKRLIDGLCKANKLQRTFKYFRDMRLHGIVPYVITYTLLLDGLHKNGHCDRTMSFLREMNNGAAPDIMICNIPLDSLCESGCVKDAKDFFFDLLSSGLKPDCTTYTTMIKGLFKKGLVSEAAALLRKTEDNGCFPNSNTYIRGFILNDGLQNAFCYRGIMVNRGSEAEAETTSLFVDLLSSDQ